MRRTWLLPLLLCLPASGLLPTATRRLAIGDWRLATAIGANHQSRTANRRSARGSQVKLVAAVVPPDATAEPALRTAPTAPRQGQALIVNVAGVPASARPALQWDRRLYPIYRVG